MLLSQQEIAADALVILGNVQRNRRNRNDDYCIHGKYVGGCGADLMCHWCEDGTTDSAYAWLIATERAERRQQRYAMDVLVPLLGRILTIPAIADMSDQHRRNIVEGFCTLTR